MASIDAITAPTPTRDEVLARLRSHEAEIRALGVEHLYLYGSVARGEAGPGSDVDLFFDRDPHRALSLLDLVDIDTSLAAILTTKVDVGTRTSLHPVLRRDIERDAVQVF